MKFVIKLSFALSLLFTFSCKKNNNTTTSSSTNGILPNVTTVNVFSIGSISAECTINVNSAGNSVLTAIGVCWDTVPNPTIHNNYQVYSGVGTGSFVVGLTGLKARTSYYARGFASNASGTAYGSEQTFTTLDAWTITGLSKNIRCLIPSGNNLVAGATDGIYISSDEGMHWTQATIPTASVSSFAKGATYLFACTSSGLYRSPDNGANWSIVNIGITDPVIAIAANGSALFVSTNAYSVRKSVDNGDSWNSVTQVNAVFNVTCLSFNGSDLYAVTGGNNAVFKSSDSGSSWNSNYTIPLYPSYGQSVTAIVFSGNNVLAGTSNGVYLATGGSGNWSQIVSSPASILNLTTEGNNVYTAGTGIYMSTDNGNSFSSMRFSSGSLAVAADPQYYFAASSSGVYRMHR